jgi:hypothetical protein
MGVNCAVIKSVRYLTLQAQQYMGSPPQNFRKIAEDQINTYALWLKKRSPLQELHTGTPLQGFEILALSSK